MTNDTHIVLAPYLDLVHRYRLAAVCTLAVGLALTLLVAVMLPSVYRSSTLVLIHAQEISPSYLPFVAVGRLQDRLGTLGEEVLSRTRLERIIKSYNLYDRRRASGKPVEEIVDYMRAHVRITISPDKQANDSVGGSVSVSYEYPDPLVAQRVAAKLADVLIRQDARERAREVAVAAQFLQDTLQTTRRELEAKGQEIRLFKDRFRGSLPEDLDANLKSIADLQSSLQGTKESLLQLDERRIQLDREAAWERRESLTIASSSGAKTLASPQAALHSMEMQLTGLRAQYSERYPDVVQLEAQIDALKAELRRTGTSGKDNESPVGGELRKERDEIALEKDRLENRLTALRSRIENYQNRIAAVPAHEQQLADLTRDYTTLAGKYGQILDATLAAKMSQSLEEREQGDRFHVLDPANLPTEPVGPDRLAIAIVGVTLSLVLALVLPFALFYTDSSFKDPEELKREYETPIAASIPRLDEVEDPGRRRRDLVRALLLSSACFVAGAGAVWLYAATVF